MLRVTLRDGVENHYGKPIGEILRDRYPKKTLRQVADEFAVVTGRKVDIGSVYYWLNKSGIHLSRVAVRPDEQIVISKRRT